MNEAVNHPKHYTQHPSGIECIEVTRHMSFCLGNAFKYVFRHQGKGKPIEDIDKAIWYLRYEIGNNTNSNLPSFSFVARSLIHEIYKCESEQALKSIYLQFYRVSCLGGQGESCRKEALQGLVASVEIYASDFMSESNET
ncbi:MAG: DUF3310 domain-containing protein [Arenicella sp.]